MKHRNKYIETIVLAMFACSFCVLGGLSSHLDPLNWVYRSSLWATKSRVIRLVIGCYGAVLVVAALASYLMIRHRATTLSVLCVHGIRSVAQEVHLSFKWFCKTTEIKDAAVWLALISAVGAAVRSYFLAQPMRYDEAYWFLFFVNRGLSDLFYYPLPNNHVLFTLLARMSVEVFGSHPIVIRMPAFIAGICAIPMTFCLSRLLTGSRRSGFLASGLVAVFPYLVLYDTMARGYSLLVLLSLCLAILGFRVVEQPSTRVCFLISLIIALGLWVMPSFLFPAAGLFFWALVMLVQQGRRPMWVLAHMFMPCSVLTMGLVGLFYTPTIISTGGIHSLYANDIVKSLPWSEFLDRLPSHISDSVSQFTRDIPAVIIVCILLLFLIGLYTLIRNRRWDAFALFPSLVLGGSVVLFSKHTIPFNRTWIYVIPFTLTFVDVGFVGMVKTANIYFRTILLLLTGIVAVLIMSHGIIDSYPDTGRFPEASIIVKALSVEMNPGDEIMVKCPANFPVYFYMWQQKIPHVRSETKGAVAPRKFFVVQKSNYSLRDLTEQSVRKLLEIDDAELYVSGPEQ